MESEFISVGANRQPHASDYNGKVVAYGAGRTIAIWDISKNTVIKTLKGHEKMVTAVSFMKDGSLVSASQDSTIKIWNDDNKCVNTLEGHTKSITAMCVIDDLIISGSADGSVRFWKDGQCTDVQKINARFYPLCVEACKLNDDKYAVAVGGSSNHVYIFVGTAKNKFELNATLEGHENWIRSLSFTLNNQTDILLASASQDRYIRLWRFHYGDVDSIQARTAEETEIQQLTNKPYYIDEKKYSVTFEALIMGHDDWVFSVQWHPTELKLLSSSADSSAIIWHPDESSGVWVGLTRLGDLSLKGSSTATGSSGGFWNAMWIGDSSVTVLGKTGSWRRWIYQDNEWKTALGVSGNTKETTGLSWEDNGQYFLTTSLDQTTRLFSKYKDSYYYEMSRPQIHGYDMVTIQSITPTRFVSGGDEKLLRVFEEPKGIAYLLENISGVKSNDKNAMVDSAVVPVLGLSNKQEAEADNSNEQQEDEDEDENKENSHNIFSFLSDLDHPPFEDHLQRLTLWPEVDKLYGHGYEMSCLAVSHDKSVIATCCKANSEKHAVVRLYDTKSWHMVENPLAAHSLTITSVQFSPDDKLLLTVSRDRTWALWNRAENNYELYYHEKKGHSRIIWDCSWIDNERFVTAGRDKSIKLWKIDQENKKADEVSITKFSSPVTAIDVKDDKLVAGLDDGKLAILQISEEKDKLSVVAACNADDTPDLRVSKVLFNPTDIHQVAVASDDASVRIYRV